MTIVVVALGAAAVGYFASGGASSPAPRSFSSPQRYSVSVEPADGPCGNIGPDAEKQCKAEIAKAQAAMKNAQGQDEWRAAQVMC